MKRFAALILCLVMICSCGLAQCFADEGEQVETAVVIIPEAPLCLDYAGMNQILEVLENSDGYLKVRTANGVEGLADARWLNIFPASCKAQVRPERAEVFAEMLKQGDTVEVIERGEEFTKVRVNDVEGEIETRFLRFDGEEEYQSWTCYSAPNTLVFNNPWLRDATGKIVFDSRMLPHGDSNATWVRKNTEFTVLADLGYCCLVKNDSFEGYIAKSLALDAEVDYTLWPNPYTPKAAAEVEPDNPGGDNPGGGDIPGGGGNTDPDPGDMP